MVENEILSDNKRQASIYTNLLMVENEILPDPKTGTETFNTYFSSIAGKLQGKIYHAGQDFNKYLKDKNP